MGRPRKDASAMKTASQKPHASTPNQSSAFDFLVSAITAASNLAQPYQHSYGGQQDHYQSNGSNGSSRNSVTGESSRGKDRRGNSGVGSPLKALVNQNVPPPSDTATSLDQVFGHSNFSNALLTTQPGPPQNQSSTTTLPTPFYMSLLQNLAPDNQSAYNTFPQGSMQATPIQQTRSGRISRPPLPNQNVLKALQILNQPGMEVVRDALGTTGLLDGFQKIAEESQRTEEAQRNQQENLENALRAMMGNNSNTGQAIRKEDLSGESGRKRRRKSNTRSPTPPPLDPHFHSTLQQYSGHHNDHDHEQGSPYESDQHNTSFPPAAKGKGSRLSMSKEEILFRRRERNKASAMASRTKVKDRIGELEALLRNKEQEIEEVRGQCGRMAKEIETLKQIIISSGLDAGALQRTLMSTLPNTHTFDSTTMNAQTQFQTGIDAFNAHPPMMNTQSPSIPQQNPTQSFADSSQTFLPPIPIQSSLQTAGNTPHIQQQQPQMPSQLDTQLDTHQQQSNLGVPTPFTDATFTPDTTFNGEPIFDFNMFMNMEQMDDELDGDFEPETSPRQGSERSDSDNEDNDDNGENEEEKEADQISHARPLKDPIGDGMSEKRPIQQYETPMDGDGDNDGEDEFIDPEMEDEDLFLPIEDVPIPPEVIHDLTGDMMKALKVDTRDQLAAVMQKLVDSAGEGGVGSEVVEKLKSVIYLAQAQERR